MTPFLSIHSITNNRLLHRHMGIRDSLALEQRLDELHTFKNLLFLETPSDDLYTNGQTVHIIGIVALERIALDLVPWSERKHEFIERAVHARDGHDARGVVKLQQPPTSVSTYERKKGRRESVCDTHNVEQKRIPASLPQTPAVPVSHRGQRVRHGQHEIESLLFPVLEPLGAIALALPDEAVELLPVFHVPALDERGVDRVAEDVAVEPCIELDQDPGKA